MDTRGKDAASTDAGKDEQSSSAASSPENGNGGLRRGAVATRSTCIRYGTERLQEAGRDAPRRTAIWLLCDLDECSRASIYGYPDQEVASDVVTRFIDAIERRASGEPLQHILGYSEFFGLRLHVSPDVLIPRPETEEVVEYALKTLRGVNAPRILDAGTGSGCIALALKSERPDADVVACDVSESALEVARANARDLKLDVDLRRADMLHPDFPSALGTSYDLLISNPPYIPDEEAESLSDTVREYDPHLALFSGDDALQFYRQLAEHADVMLSPGGCLIVETHAHYASGVADVFARAGLTDVQIEQDLGGRPRIARASKPSAD